MNPTKLPDRRPQLCLLQDPRDLLNRKPLPLLDKTSVRLDSILPQNSYLSRSDLLGAGQNLHSTPREGMKRGQ